MKKLLIVDSVSIYESIIPEFGDAIQHKFIIRIDAKNPKKFTTKKALEAFRNRVKRFAKQRLGKDVYVAFISLKTLDEKEPDGWVLKNTLIDNGIVKVIDSKYNEKTYAVILKTNKETKEVTKTIELQDE